MKARMKLMPALKMTLVTATPASSHTKKRPVSANRDASGRVHAASGADLPQRSVAGPGRVPSSAIPVPIQEAESQSERKKRRRKELELEQRRKNSDSSVVEPACRRPDVVEDRAREADVDAADDQAKKQKRRRTTIVDFDPYEKDKTQFLGGGTVYAIAKASSHFTSFFHRKTRIDALIAVMAKFYGRSEQFIADCKRNPPAAKEFFKDSTNLVALMVW